MQRTKVDVNSRRQLEELARIKQQPEVYNRLHPLTRVIIDLIADEIARRGG